MNRSRVAWCCALAICKCLLLPEWGAAAGPPPTGTITVQPPGAMSENSYPMIQKNARWQQVYDDSFFGAVPIRIASFGFFSRFGLETISYGSDFSIRMSTTEREPGNLSSRFDDNIGADVKTVYEGPITLTAIGGQWTNINLMTPFVFDPTAGNLLLEVSHGPSVAGGFYLAHLAYEPRPAGLQRLSASDNIPSGGSGPPFSVGSLSGFGELVTRFTTLVPEPSSPVMIFTALALATRLRTKSYSRRAVVGS